MPPLGYYGAMEQMPRRRWFRFSLRTLFVAMMMGCITTAWLTYHLRWIRQRHILCFSDAPLWTWPSWNSTAPGMLWLFGERGLDSIELELNSEKQASEWVRRANTLFPEASVKTLITQLPYRKLSARSGGICWEIGHSARSDD